MNKLDMIEASIKCVAEMCVKSRTSKRQNLQLKKTLAKLMLLKTFMIEEPTRRMWVRPIYSVEQRMLRGEGEILKSTEPNLYFSQLRMSPAIFEELFKVIGPKIEKQICVREPISARSRLQIYLRYLATGATMRDIGNAFRVAPNTVSKIITETCHAIRDQLTNLVMPTPNTEDWERISNEFNSAWNYPHCIGALDERCMIVQTPTHSSSVCLKSKKLCNTIIITGIADAKFRFTIVNVGSEAYENDGMFSESSLKSKLDNDELNIPAPSEVSYRILPYVLVADEAYPLSHYIMKPYPVSEHSDFKRKVFNFRLNQARKAIDTAFGIFIARWHIFGRPMLKNVNKAQKTILATMCLHNFIITKELELGENQYSRYTENNIDCENSNIKKLKKKPNNRCKQVALKYRDTFAQHFMDEGAVDWQWEKALNDDYE